MKVLKFGGTSVQDAAAILNLANIVSQNRGSAVVIVSALARVTDQLFSIAKLCENGDPNQAKKQAGEILQRHLDVAKNLGLDFSILERVTSKITSQFSDLEKLIDAFGIIKEVSPRSLDSIVSNGELASSHLVSAAIRSSAWFDSREFIKTNSDFGKAQVDFEKTFSLLQNWKKEVENKNQIFVGQGFIGKNSSGATTTLGRGGSDYSATIFGAGLEADSVEIWTDVDGILTTDPRVVPEAQLIERISFEAATELAFFGAKVIHPETIFPAVEKKIPVLVLNSKNPSCTGTQITFEQGASAGISGIAFKRNVTVINIYSTRMLGAHGFLKSVFDIFSELKISVDLITTSEVNISLTLDPATPLALVEAIRTRLSSFATIEITNDHSMISIVGGAIRNTSGLAAKVFMSLGDINVKMISLGASELNLSLVVKTENLNQAVKKLHHSFFQAQSESLQ